eukprot:681447-Hanusia_phi.AAC.1
MHKQCQLLSRHVSSVQTDKQLLQPAARLHHPRVREQHLHPQHRLAHHQPLPIHGQRHVARPALPPLLRVPHLLVSYPLQERDRVLVQIDERSLGSQAPPRGRRGLFGQRHEGVQPLQQLPCSLPFSDLSQPLLLSVRLCRMPSEPPLLGFAGSRRRGRGLERHAMLEVDLHAAVVE